MNKIKLTLLTIFLVSFFVSNSIDTGVTVTQLDKTIWTIYQDKKSNYWFGSKENGVYYYNGQRLKHITTENGLVSNEIRGIQEDANGNVYFDTEKGVSKFDGRTFKTLQIANPASPLNDWVLKPDDLWFRMGFKSGAYRFDGKYLHYLKFPISPQENMFYMKNPNTSLKPYGLYTIYKDRKGYMWFGTASLGVCRYDGRTLNWHYEEQLQTTPNGGDFGTRAIFEDKNGKIWINNTRFRYVIETYGYKSVTFKKESGIGYLNKTNKMEFPFFLSITEDNKGNLWMATYENGVWKYNGKELIHYPVKDGETDVLLFTIYKDNKGVLWLGTHNAGVYTFNGHSFEKFIK
jgi:ligand-binding sensor domain-containing protein